MGTLTTIRSNCPGPTRRGSPRVLAQHVENLRIGDVTSAGLVLARHGGTGHGVATNRVEGAVEPADQHDGRTQSLPRTSAMCHNVGLRKVLCLQSRRSSLMPFSRNSQMLKVI